MIISSKTLLSVVCPASWVSRQCKYGRFLQEKSRKLYAPVQPWRAARLGLAPVHCDIIISDEVIIYIEIFRCMFSRQKNGPHIPLCCKNMRSAEFKFLWSKLFQLYIICPEVRSLQSLISPERWVWFVCAPA